MRKYKYNKTYKNVYLGTGIFCLLAALFMQIVSMRTPPAMFLPIIIYFIYKNFIVVKTTDTYCEIKIAPLRSLQICQYSEVSRVGITQKKITMYMKNSKEIKIPFNILNKSEHHELIEFLKSKTTS
jgi:hypothetical protein